MKRKRSKGFRKDSVDPKVRINGSIRSMRLRVIGAEGTQLGILDLSEALSQARLANLDLVEIAPQADPPVAKIMDYGKYKYQQEKKAKESKKKAHTVVLKEVKLRPKIGQNDLDVKKKQMVEFLEAGNKVKITMMFRGREMAYTERGQEILDRIVVDLQTVAEPEESAKIERRNMFLIMSPKKS